MGGGGCCRGWIDMAQDREMWHALVNAVIHNELPGSIKCREFLD